MDNGAGGCDLSSLGFLYTPLKVKKIRGVKNMLKKFRSLALLTAIMCLFTQTFAYADTLVKSYVPASAEQRAVDYLTMLGITEKEDTEAFMSEEGITKGEAAYLLVKTIGLNVLNGQMNTNRQFADFPSDMKYAEIVPVAVNQGILSGDENGVLGLENTIGYEQAVKMFVAAMGYDIRAQLSGGYPAGYIIWANNLGLLRDVQGGGMNKSVFAKIMYNALSAKVMKQDSFSNGDTSHYTADETLEELYLRSYDMVLNEGIVEATKFTTLTADRNLKNDEVIIGGNRLDAEGSTIGNYIGYKVKYAAEDKDEYSVPRLKGFVVTKENTVYNLNRDSDPVYKGDRVNYTDTERDKDEYVKLSSNAVYIYNNRKLESFAASQLDFGNGVRLIDNDDDDEAEVVVWTSSMSYIVDSINEVNEMIYLADATYNGSAVIKTEDDDNRNLLVINTEGEKIDWRSIKKDDAISVIESTDKKYLEIILLPEPFTGRITEMQENKVKINDTWYYTAAQFEEPEFNKLGKFYTNESGEVFKFEKSTSDYVYLIKKDNSSGLGSNMQIKIYDNYTGIKIYDLDDKVKVDTGTTTLSGFDAIPTGVVVSLTMNADGKVKTITTATKYGGQVERKYCKYAHAFNEGVIKDANGTATGDYDEPFKFNEDTMFFVIPTEDNDEDYGAVPDYKDGTAYNTQAYECDPDTNFVKAVVVTFDAEDFIKDDPKVGIVTKVIQGLDDEQQAATFVTGFSEGEEFTYTVSGSSSAASTSAGLKKGDVIRFNKNYSGEIIKLEILASLSTQSEFMYNDRNGENEVFYGPVILLRKAIITDLSKYLYHELQVSTSLSYNNMTTMRIYAHLKNTENENYEFNDYYIYDRADDKITLASIDDVVPYSKDSGAPSYVFVHRNSASVSNTKILVIVKN